MTCSGFATASSRGRKASEGVCSRDDLTHVDVAVAKSLGPVRQGRRPPCRTVSTSTLCYATQPGSPQYAAIGLTKNGGMVVHPGG